MALRRPSSEEKPPLEPILDHYGLEYDSTRSGWLKQLCFFHDETQPSMVLNLDLRSWKCFSCDASGCGPIQLIIDRENVDFKTAVERYSEITGERYGQVPGGSGRGSRRSPSERVSKGQGFVPAYKRRLQARAG